MSKKQITRRDFMKQTAVASVGLMAVTSCQAISENPANNPSPKNVLILMTDQQNAKALSCLSHPHIKTPNLDRLAREGVLFENSCCAYPVCTASRGALHTGRWPHVKGPNMNSGMPDTNPNKGLPADEILLGTGFYDRGYKTCHYGKWHLGDIRRHSAWNWREGLENYHPARVKMINKYNKSHPVNVPPGHTTLYGWPFYMTEACKRAFDNSDALGIRKQTNILKVGRIGLPLEADKTTWVTNSVLEDLDKYGDEPFMMVWSVDPPHAEWAVQDPYYSAVDFNKVKLPKNMTRPLYRDNDFACRLYNHFGKEGVREYLRCYYGQIMKVDDQIGRILNKLEGIGHLDDTLIVFTSDHGDMNAAHKAVGKGLDAFYDEIVKVPLIMRWPKGIKKGRRVKTLVNNVDVMPTILDYAGFTIPQQCQGQSLRCFIDGQEDMDRAGFCERTHPIAEIVGRMIRTQEWKLSIYYKAGKNKKKPFIETRPLELFNLIKDPGEENNLGADPAYTDVRKQLLKRLLEWMKQTKDPWLERLPE